MDSNIQQVNFCRSFSISIPVYFKVKKRWSKFQIQILSPKRKQKLILENFQNNVSTLKKTSFKILIDMLSQL